MGEHKNFYKKGSQWSNRNKEKIKNKERSKNLEWGVKKAIENKWTAYQKYLQNHTEENFETYKIKRNTAKTIVSKTHNESWDRFISRIESDIFGEQSMAYKVLKHLNRTNKDTIKMNNTDDQKRINRYKNLWWTNFPHNNNDEPETTTTPSAGIDEISNEELEQSLKSMKNRKQLDQTD